MNNQINMDHRVADYLKARRALGYQLRIEGEELGRFARFAIEKNHIGPITTELALDWASSAKNPSDLYRSRRLEIVRCLAKYCALFEPSTEIPPKSLLGPAHQRKPPYIYTCQEIADLMQAASELIPKGGLRPQTLQCVFGLLATTGLRISEALRLVRGDVDLERTLILVQKTKFNKSRYIPIHHTTAKALQAYANARNQLVLKPQNDAFFLMDNGKALGYRQVLYAFQCIRGKLGWKPRNGQVPRMHDLRHTFASYRLLHWYREGLDVNHALPYLSTYLGHGKVTDTYWYLTGVPELLDIAMSQFQHFIQRKGGLS